MQRRRLKVKADLVALFGGKCKRCGYSKSKRALAFHHRDRSMKKFQICGPTVLGWAKLVAEAEKCDLLCANCHAEVEDELTGT